MGGGYQSPLTSRLRAPAALQTPCCYMDQSWFLAGFAGACSTPPQGWIDTKFKSMPPFLMCIRTPRSFLGHCPSSTQEGCMSQGGSSFGLRSNHIKDPQSNHRSITKTPLRPQPIHNPLCQYPLLINLQLNFHHPTCGNLSGFPTTSAACWSIPGIWDPKRSLSLPEVFPSFFCFFLAPLYPLPGY